MKNNIPKASQNFINGLSRKPKSHYKTAGPIPSMKALVAAEDEAATKTDFVYNGLTEQDLQYDSSQYPVSGKFSETTPAWLNDLQTVPSDWQWSDYWYEYNKVRTAQISAEMDYIDTHVPGQTYQGKTADVIEQMYTKGMWDPRPAPNDPRPTPLPIFDTSKIATLTQNWIRDDQEFARQRLGGANPNVIKVADAANYDIANWINKSANANSLSNLQNTLVSAQNDGALFVCDYTKVIGPAVTNQYLVKDRYLEAPICFFTVDSNKKSLIPVAIQIKGTDPSSYIFTPDDVTDTNGDAWLSAKIWAGSADQQWWFSGSHLMNCHSIVMLFGIGALNQIQDGILDTSHPMVVLAKPFLTQVFNINNVVISAPGSGEGGAYQKGKEKPNFCDGNLPTGRIGLYQIISDLYKDYTFEANAFPAQMSSRGLDSGKINDVFFPYRDDGSVWWDSIKTFVTNIVNASYASDNDVTGDQGLTGWMNVVQTAFNKDGTTRFTAPNSRSTLIDTFTNLLFTCSAKHTSVNDTMLPGWAFTPNGPFSMIAPAPTDAASVTQTSVLASLPDPQTSDGLTQVKNQITFVMAGTAIVDETETAGMSPSDINIMLAAHPYPDGSPQQQAVKDFWNAIWTDPNNVKDQISNNQQARIASWNGASPVPYSLSYYYLSAFLSPCVGPEYLNAPTMNSIQI